MPAITCGVQPESHKRKQKKPHRVTPSLLPGCLVSRFPAIPCWLLWVEPSEVIFDPRSPLVLSGYAPKHIRLPTSCDFFLHNLLSPDSVAYVCTLVPVLQHICRGLRTTLESLFSPPTRDPTNKTQVVQLPWQGLLPMEASLHPRRCSIFILSLASIVLKIERKLF